MEVDSSSSTERPPFLSQELDEEAQGLWFSSVMIFGLAVGSNTSEALLDPQPQPTVGVNMVLRRLFLLEDMREDGKPFAA